MTIDANLTLRSIDDLLRYLALKPPARRAVLKKNGKHTGLVEYAVAIPEEGMKVETRIFVNPTSTEWNEESTDLPGYIYIEVQAVDVGGSPYVKQRAQVSDLRERLAEFGVDVADYGTDLDAMVAEAERRRKPYFLEKEALQKELQERVELRRIVCGTWRGRKVSIVLRLPVHSSERIEWYVEDIRPALISEEDEKIRAAGYEIFE